MQEKHLEFTLAPETLKLLETIESTSNENERIAAINALAQSGDASRGRVLIEVYERCMWRTTKVLIVRAMGPIPQDRVMEFLIRLASDREDLAMGREAVLALGAEDNPVAGEFLLSILVEKEHPLCREAVIALTYMAYFPCEDELLSLLERPDTAVSPALLQYVIVALGRRGYASLWEKIELFLDLDKEAETIFNAAIIATGLLGGREAMDKLRSLDTRYRFFSHQLKIMAIERIQLRLGHAVEDAILKLISAKDGFEKRQALRLLKEFPKKESWEAFELFGKEVEPELACLVRTVLFDGARQSEDKEFILKHRRVINPDVLAALVRLHAHASGKDFLDDLYSELTVQESILLMIRVKEEKALQRLEAIISDEKNEKELRIKAINAMVSQTLMAGKNSTITLKVGKLLFDRMNNEQDLDIKGRIIRALGQVGCNEDNVLIAFAALLKEKDGSLFSSVYAALSKFEGEEPAHIILRRIKNIVTREDKAYELIRAVWALALIGRLPETEPLSSVPEALLDSTRVPLLKISSENPAYGMNKLVAEALVEEDFRIKILAIAAAKYNNNPAIWGKLFELISDANLCLAGRALDSLCIGGSREQHEKLLKWLQDDHKNKAIALKIFYSLAPDQDDDYKAIINMIGKLLELKNEVFQDKEVQTAAGNLRDNLLMLVHKQEQEKLKRTDIPGVQEKQDAVDKRIAASLKGFPKYSEQVKSVLRNAELTYHHPELFDNRVDKSTVVVEFVKSIDILLQEKIGSKMFLDPASDLLADMQSRIVQMQLDDESITAAQIVKDFQCGTHFSVDDFPSHKLHTLSQDILSGKILNSQYRSIDGLRAWALLMLTFGRKFKFRKIPVEPIFPVKLAVSQEICQISAHMNILQNMRNQAAHRGTMLDLTNLEEIRLNSFEVLNKLQSVLA